MATIGQEEFLVIKLDSSGNVDWQDTITQIGEHNRGNKMCFDSNGNIIVTGTAQSPYRGDHDFLTVGIDPNNGKVIWQDYFNGADQGDDEATDITSDNDGNIYVTGQAWINSELQTVTIKYRTDYFTQPPSVDTPSVAYLFYPNSGQLVDENRSDITGSVQYYTVHHYPQLFFGNGVMNMEWKHVDHDTATTDSIQRVDVTFLNSSNSTEAYPVDEDTSSYLNYFLTQCPNGITNVFGNGSLLFTDVYSNIDAMYSSNNAGLKLVFICNPGSNPTEVGLAFEGQDNVLITQNWFLNVHTLLGDYGFERPRVYQLDTNNNRIQLSWQLSWNIPQTGDANFVGWGNYDMNKPLVIEIAKNRNTFSNAGLPRWSTYIGGASDDVSTSVCTDIIGQACITGFTESYPFISQIGLTSFQFQNKGLTDAFISKFTTGGELKWWTYYGGPGFDRGWDIAYDKEGSDERLYIVGNTDGPDSLPFFVTSDTNCYQQKVLNGLQGTILELNAITGIPIWSTTIGGEWTFLNACAVDHNHNVVIVGNDLSFDYPSTTNCLPQPYSTPLHARMPVCDPGNGAYFQYLPSRDPGPGGVPPHVDNDNGIILRFNSYGVMNYSTFFGGNGDDNLEDVAIDSSGNIFITGGTFSYMYPACTTTCSATAPFSCEGLFPVCNNTGNLNTYYSDQRNVSGGYPNNADGIIIKLDNNLNLKWSTFFGSKDFDFCSSIACNSNGDIYVAGYTNCRYEDTLCTVPTNNYYFPICHQNGAYTQTAYGGSTLTATDNFITRFSNDGVLKWSSFIGGFGNESGSPKLATDFRDNVYLTGWSQSPELSGQAQMNTVQNGTLFYQSNNMDASFGNYNGADGYIVCFSEAWNNPIWATYFGGIGMDFCYNVATTSAGFLYVVGETESVNNFPINITFSNSQCCSDTLSGGKDAFLSQFLISGLINVEELKNKIINLTAYPSPASDFINIEFHSNSKFPFDLAMYNMLGEKCFFEKGIAVPGINNIKISTVALRNGMYFLNISGDQTKNSIKFIKNE